MTEKKENVGVRRSEVHVDLMKQLTGTAPYRQQEAAFKFMYDVLVFAASVGFKLQKRVAIDKFVSDPIPYSTMKSNEYFETLLSTIAVLTFEGDHTCLSDDRLVERVRVFEEYANGGLDYLQEQLAAYGGSSRKYIETLTTTGIAAL